MNPGPDQSLSIVIDARFVREKPSEIGAYVQALVDRLPALAPHDHFLFWAHPLAARTLSRAANTSAVTVRAGPNSPWPVLYPRRYASFAEVDVFHSPHNTMPRGLPCASVITVHDVMTIEEPSLYLQGLERFVKRLYYQQAVWRALREATCLIAPSKATADRICALAPEAAKRLTVIWSAPDSAFHPPNDAGAAQTQAARLTSGDSPYLLVVGASAPNKRHDLAVAAFAQTVPAPWRLVFLQRRRTNRDLVRLARQMQVEDRVVWLDTVSREALVTLLQAAGGLIQPSIYEGFGLSVLEAMACGCPVVASNIPAIREVTAGTALLFAAGNVAALAKALSGFVRSRTTRQSLAEQGLARSRDFSSDDCARATLHVYHEAAAAGRL
jgi:glycosyltransferase involved in cell wall biosynthesis